MSNHKLSWKEALPSILAFIFFISQILYGVLYSDNIRISIVEYLGVGVFILSGFFGMAPVLMFPKKGGVKKGKSFIYTTKIVDTGIYSIVRHPQYSAFILWAIGAMLLFQSWEIIVLGIPVIILTYCDMMREDKRNILKFGDSYRLYMKKVPRTNFILGLIRKLKVRD